GAREFGRETECDRIAATDEHDRYGRGGSPGRAQGGNRTDDHGHLPMHQICRECRQAIELVLGPAEFDRYVVAVDEPGFLQAITECRYPVTGFDSRTGVKEADPRHRLLLRIRSERPRRRAAEQRYELAPLHSITSSARPESGSGTVMPSARAVLRFRNSSTLVDC